MTLGAGSPQGRTGFKSGSVKDYPRCDFSGFGPTSGLKAWVGAGDLGGKGSQGGTEGSLPGLLGMVVQALSSGPSFPLWPM